VAAAQAQVKRLEASGKNRPKIANLLIAGRSEQTIEDPEAKGPDGKPVKLKVPGVPKTKQLVASVALDLALDGHVSKHNVERLHKRGLSLRDLGFPTKAPPLKKAAADPLRPAGVAGPAGVN
jgi:hypothetical protein